MLRTLVIKRRQFLTAALLFGLVVAAMGQATDTSDRPVNSLVNNKDRAGHLADLVSLSPAAITQLLQREPGLLLEVKKALVRKAYEEGRLLNPEDLTDESVFQLLQDDASARSLATREIEARMYVRANPNADEVHQNPDWTIVEKTSFQGRGSTEQSSSGNQEAQYWATHEELPLSQPQTGTSPQAEDDGPSEPANSVPAPRILQNPRVQPSLTAIDNAAPEWFSPPETMATSNMSSPGLVGVLNASLSRPADASGGISPEARRSTPQIATGAPLPEIMAPSSVSGYSTGKNVSGNGAVPWLAVPSQSGKSQNESDASRVGLHRQANPYQDVPSLYDLYKQFSKRSPVPQRFGMDVFQNGTGNSDQLPMDVPAGPDYVLGPGDGLSIEIWGSASGHLQRVVDREGVISLPETGSVQVTGKSLAEVQQLVQHTLRTQYRDAQADISLARLRTVRVYVVGDVTRPGAYDVSALSTPLNALYLAGGPTSRGSLRVLPPLSRHAIA